MLVGDTEQIGVWARWIVGRNAGLVDLWVLRESREEFAELAPTVVIDWFHWVDAWVLQDDVEAIGKLR